MIKFHFIEQLSSDELPILEFLGVRLTILYRHGHSVCDPEMAMAYSNERDR